MFLYLRGIPVSLTEFISFAPQPYQASLYGAEVWRRLSLFLIFTCIIMKKICFLVILLTFSSAIACAQKMKIVRCTTPTIIIEGVKCHIGDTFDKDAKITWVSSKQVMIAKDEKGQLLRFAASQDKKGDPFMTKLMNKQNQSLSTRDFATEGIDGIYILDKQLCLPTGLDSDKKYTVELHYTADGKERIYNARLSAGNASMTIKKKIFDGKYTNIIKAKAIAREKGKNKEILLSENIQLVHIERAIMPD